jgi:6-pyruvoyltetrahydropterin/6-carboxytetrahydropterin synthase
MVIDYGDLKKLMMTHIDARLDHGFMVYSKDPLNDVFNRASLFHGMKIIVVDFIPTAENIAKYLYKILEMVLKHKNIKLKYVTVWETPTSTANYHEGDAFADRFVVKVK